jgi:TPR repeat protein
LELRDHEEGFKHFSIAAELGNADAQSALASCRGARRFPGLTTFFLGDLPGSASLDVRDDAAGVAGVPTVDVEGGAVGALELLIDNFLRGECKQKAGAPKL